MKDRDVMTTIDDATNPVTPPLDTDPRPTEPIFDKCADPDCLRRRGHEGWHHVAYPDHPKAKNADNYRRVLKGLIDTAEEVSVSSPDSNGVVHAMRLDWMEQAYGLLGYPWHPDLEDGGIEATR